MFINKKQRIIKIPIIQYIALDYILYRVGKVAHSLQIPFRENINLENDAYLNDERTARLDKYIMHEIDDLNKANNLISLQQSVNDVHLKVNEIDYDLSKAEILVLLREFTFINNENNEYTRKKLILLLFDPGLAQRVNSIVFKLSRSIDKLNKKRKEYNDMLKVIKYRKYFHEDEKQTLDDLLSLYKHQTSNIEK